MVSWIPYGRTPDPAAEAHAAHRRLRRRRGKSGAQRAYTVPQRVMECNCARCVCSVLVCMYGRCGPVIHRSCRPVPPPLLRNPTRRPNSSTPTGPGEGSSPGIQDSLDRCHDLCPARPPGHAKLAPSTVLAHAPHHHHGHRMMASADVLTSVAPPRRRRSGPRTKAGSLPACDPVGETTQAKGPASAALAR